MKKLIKAFLAFSFISIFAVPAAQSQIAITLDENGSALTPPFVLALDPTLGGAGPLVLTYILPFPGVTSGDLILTEPGTQQQPSDLVRFITANPNVAGAPSTALFYSDNQDLDPGPPDKADVGFPPNIGIPFGAPLVIPEVGPENNNGAVYVAAPPLPGSVPGVVVTYTIISDIPEPSTYALLGLGALGLLVWRRKKSVTA